jgi:hypothetical protein
MLVLPNYYAPNFNDELYEKNGIWHYSYLTYKKNCRYPSDDLNLKVIDLARLSAKAKL